MYNAFKFKKDQEKALALKEGVAHPKLKNPEAAQRKLNRMANNAKIRRDAFIGKCDLDEDEFGSKLTAIYF